MFKKYSISSPVPSKCYVQRAVLAFPLFVRCLLWHQLQARFTRYFDADENILQCLASQIYIHNPATSLVKDRRHCHLTGKNSETTNARTWDLEKLTSNFALENRSWSNSSTKLLWRRCPKTQRSLISFSITKKLSMCQIHRGIAQCHVTHNAIFSFELALESCLKQIVCT